jgi:hypothetical protein
MVKPRKSKALCRGCRDDFYNGKQNCTGEGCWSYESAQVIKRKRVPLDQRPPWKQRAIWAFSCRTESGCIFVRPEVNC